MTLNQVIQRLRTIALSHRQIKTFYYGNIWEWLQQNTGKVIYPACLVEHNTSAINTTGKITTHQFRVYLLDLVNVSNDAEGNETEVLSDMMSVAQDIVALCKDPYYENAETDVWFTDGNAQALLYTGKLNDYTAGVSIDLPISTLNPTDRCSVPVSH